MLETAVPGLKSRSRPGNTEDDVKPAARMSDCWPSQSELAMELDAALNLSESQQNGLEVLGFRTIG